MTLLNANWVRSIKMDGSECPIFVKKINIKKKPLSAHICVTAIGIYELYVNGKKVGDELFAPGWTSYHKRLMYQDHDILAYLSEGENEIAVHTAPGWAVGYLGRGNTNHKFFDHISVTAMMQLEYADGDSEAVVTDKSWQVMRGQVITSEFYHGEHRDLTAACEYVENAAEDTSPKTVLVPDGRVPVREQERVAPVKLIVTPKGERVIDFGQNLAGYVEIKVKGRRGDRIVISHAEVLDSEGNFYTKNLELAECRNTYVLSGGEDILKPAFSFQGYRYIRLDEYPFDTVDLCAFTSVAIYSDIERTGDFVCGNAKINKLYSNTIWGQRSNFIDIPTDCPQRDERLGWTGDVLAFAKTAAINYDVKEFICKWLDDVMLEQGADGAISSVVPSVSGRGERTSTAWGDAAVVVPWELYLAYGDKEILERYFPMMEGWIRYMRAQGEEEYLWLGGWHYGDWLASDAILCPEVREGATQTDLIASAYFAYSVSLMAGICKVLGKNADEYEELFLNIKKKFREFFMRDGLPVLYPKYDAFSTTRPVKGLTQTSLTLVLKFGLYEGEEERQKLICKLLEEIEANGGCMNTGFVGTLYILQALTENGATKKAFDLFLSEKYPSWLFSVNHGATTIWEHWDGIKDDGSFWDDSKNSFNHYAYGSVFGWVYEWVLGIHIHDGGAGYKKITVAPNVDERLGFARGSVMTQYGPLEVSWTFLDNTVRYELSVPEGIEAVFVLDGKEQWCRVGKYCFEKKV